MTRRRVPHSTSEVDLLLRAHAMKASKGPVSDRDLRDLPPAHGTVVDRAAPRQRARRSSLWWRLRWWWRYGRGGAVR